MSEVIYNGQRVELHPEDIQEPSIYYMYVLARWCYLMGESIISDIEYDKIEKQFKSWYPDDIHSKQPWSFDKCPIEILKQANRQSLICDPVMGYMAESIYSINNWYELEQTLANLNERSRLSFKIDGWNTRVSYFNGNIVNIQTRGRSGTNLDIGNILGMFPKNIDIQGRVAITGELSIPHSRWPMFQNITGNQDQRASVRTALARGDIDALSFLAFNIFIENDTSDFDQYAMLKQLGFRTPMNTYVTDYTGLKNAINYMTLMNNGYDYLTDGLVIENSKFQYAIRLGAWEEQSMSSYVTGYEEGQGSYGTFLKVKCAPIKVEGKVFSKISINNIASIIENDLKIGSPIAFNLRSSANVVIDSTMTKSLQEKWKGNYEGYKNTVKEYR